MLGKVQLPSKACLRGECKMSGKEIRRRNVPHAWWDKKVFRFLSDNFSGKECIYITHIYMILCQIDSDFSEREEKPDKGIRGIVQTCATYAKMEKRTVSKYMSILRDLLLIDYGQERKKESGKLGQSFLKLFRVDENIHNKALIKHRGKRIHTTAKNPESTVVSVHRLRSGVSHKNTSNSYKNESKDSKTLSKERVIPDTRSGFNGEPLLLRIKRRKKKNNGLLYNSKKSRRYNTTSLNSWNKHPLNKNSKYDPPIIALQDKVLRVKRPMGRETQEVIDYWNKTASQLSNNGHKLPTHRLDLDTKTSYMCKLIVTGILHTSDLTVEDIKKAIDNYTKVLEDSHYYKHLYTFPQFYSKDIFAHCVEGNLSTYIKYKKEIKEEDLLEEVIKRYKMVRGYEPGSQDVKLYDWWIQQGTIKDEDDIKRVVGGKYV